MKKILSVCVALMLLFSSCSIPIKKNEQPSEQPPQSDFSSKRVIASWIYYNEIEELVKKSDSENDFIANIENAHRDIPLSRIRLIAKALNIEPYELLKF